MKIAILSPYIIALITIGEVMVDIQFAETSKLALFTFLKIFIGLRLCGLLHA